MKDVLKKVKLVRPKDLERLRKDFESAQKLLEKQDVRKAITLLKKVARFKREIGFVIEAKKALQVIEENGRQRIEEARKLVAEGKKDEGDKILREIEKELRGLDVAEEARKIRLDLYRSKEGMDELLKKEKEKQAQKLFKLGQMYEENKKSEKALAQYEKILEEYPDTETAGPASDKVKELREALGKEKDE
jgi:outer membrane protein assembly factor BamD (BamD/ComL family)